MPRPIQKKQISDEANGDLDGPASSTDNAVTRFDGTSGKVVQNSGVTLDDTGNLTFQGTAVRGVGNTEVSPSTIAAQQNNWDPTNFGTADILRVDLTGTQTVTGFAAPTGSDNHRFVLRNIDAGSDVLILAHESGSSTAANRIATPSKLSLHVQPGQSVVLWYDSVSSRWVVAAVGKAQQAVYDAGTSGTSKTIDWRVNRMQKVQLTGNVTFTFTAPSEPGMYALRIAQDATGGRTITWPSAVKWPNGFTATHPPGASKYCWFIATYDGTNYDGDLYGGLGGFG